MSRDAGCPGLYPLHFAAGCIASQGKALLHTPGSLPFKAPSLPAYDLLGCIPVFSGRQGARPQGARPLSDVARAMNYSILDTQLCSSSRGAMCRIFLGDVQAAANAMKESSLPV